MQGEEVWVVRHNFKWGNSNWKVQAGGRHRVYGGHLRRGLFLAATVAEVGGPLLVPLPP
jgi:hypothetical protein